MNVIALNNPVAVTFITVLILLLILAAIVFFTSVIKSKASGGTYEKINLPYSPDIPESRQYLYLIGGYHSIDNGAPAWGTADYSEIRLIGDEMGRAVITYEDGTTDTTPLVFGYTMWFHNHWQEYTAPLKGQNKALTDALKQSLCLLGAYEGNETCVLKIKLKNMPVRNISIADNESKAGQPVFSSAFLADEGCGTISESSLFFDTDDPFFKDHTVDCCNSYPAEIQSNLEQIRHALYTYEDEFKDAPDFKYPAKYDGPVIKFSGNSFADIASGVAFHNITNLISRIDDEGFVHTSYDKAPTWRYDGFGVWVPDDGSYYDSYYSRDGGRALLTLLLFGAKDKAAKSVSYANRQMMYFRENALTLGGIAIPGHYTVVINKPLLYSEVLVPVANWPTAYTEEAFGAEYKNLGNQETDGHGLMMMANYNTWRALGSPQSFIDDNWEYIKEASDWIVWCFDNPKLSLVKNGLLYAESEAGMREYTLYCNLPCYLGLLGYSEMAASAGHTAEAEKWKNIASGLRDAIINRLSKNGQWTVSKFGFFHDPALTMMADYYGYDLADMDEQFVLRTLAAYEKDTAKSANTGWYGAAGIGYDHSMLTQNALLTDHMKDATRLMENLSRICYAPGLPEPYMVPEGITVDLDSGILRRQGDLGNLVQQAEALKCYSIASGISPVLNRTLKLMPRLPENWSLNLFDMPVSGNASGSVDLIISYPKDGIQYAQFALKDSSNIDDVKLRFGPLPADTDNVYAMLDGESVPCEKIISGDSVWVWVDCGSTEANASESVGSKAGSSDTGRKAVLFYGRGDSVPDVKWPESWQDISAAQRSSRESGGKLSSIGNKLFFIIPGAILLTAALSAAALIVAKSRRKKQI